MQHSEHQMENVDNDFFFSDQVVQWTSPTVKYGHIYEYDTPLLGTEFPFKEREAVELFNIYVR